MGLTQKPEQLGGYYVIEVTGRAIERVARTSYGRLVALIAARSGDIAGAEDALSGAFRRALSKWRLDGVPENPHYLHARSGYPPTQDSRTRCSRC